MSIRLRFEKVRISFQIRKNKGFILKATKRRFLFSDSEYENVDFSVC